MEAVIDIKIPVMFVTGTSDFEHRIQPDPCVIAPSAPPVELMVSPDENPEESSQDDRELLHSCSCDPYIDYRPPSFNPAPSYEAAVALDSEKRVPQKLPEQLPFMDPYHRPAITTQPSSPDFAQRYSSASSSNPWTRGQLVYYHLLLLICMGRRWISTINNRDFDHHYSKYVDWFIYICIILFIYLFIFVYTYICIILFIYLFIFNFNDFWLLMFRWLLNRSDLLQHKDVRAIFVYSSSGQEMMEYFRKIFKREGFVRDRWQIQT